MGVSEVMVDGHRIAYAHAGSGPPVVLLHGGFGLDHRSWRPQIEDLSEEFAIVAWDAPGTGRSSDPPSDASMQDYADRLAAFLAAIGVDHPHVVGISYGATLALEFHRRHPHVTRSLVLAGAYAGWAGSLPPDVVQERLDRFVEDMERPPAEWIPGYIPGMFGADPTPGQVDELHSLLMDIRPEPAAVMLRQMAATDLRHVLPTIAVPTLLLYGELDARSPLTVGEELHAAIPGSQLVVLPGVGHACNFEAPERFNEAVRRFLRAVPG